MRTFTTGDVQGEPRPCWHCTAFDGMTNQGTCALCRRPGCARVRSLPALGCCAWEREPGTDDEPGPPPEAATHRSRVGALGYCPETAGGPRAGPAGAAGTNGGTFS